MFCINTITRKEHNEKLTLLWYIKDLSNTGEIVVNRRYLEDVLNILDGIGVNYKVETRNKRQKSNYTYKITLRVE